MVVANNSILFTINTAIVIVAAIVLMCHSWYFVFSQAVTIVVIQVLWEGRIGVSIKSPGSDLGPESLTDWCDAKPFASTRQPKPQKLELGLQGIFMRL